jgi:hypothetical protein
VLLDFVLLRVVIGSDNACETSGERLFFSKVGFAQKLNALRLR